VRTLLSVNATPREIIPVVGGTSGARGEDSSRPAAQEPPAHPAGLMVPLGVARCQYVVSHYTKPI
jgi:hypothetical protein